MAFIDANKAYKNLEYGTVLMDSFGNVLNSFLNQQINYGINRNPVYYGLNISPVNSIGRNIASLGYFVNEEDPLTFNNASLLQSEIIFRHPTVWDFSKDDNFTFTEAVYENASISNAVYDFPLSNETFSYGEFNPYDAVSLSEYILQCNSVAKAVEEYQYILLHELSDFIAEKLERQVKNWMKYFRKIISNIWKLHNRASSVKFVRYFIKVISSGSIDEDSALVVFMLKENNLLSTKNLIPIYNGYNRIYNRKD